MTKEQKQQLELSLVNRINALLDTRNTSLDLNLAETVSQLIECLITLSTAETSD